MSSTETAPAEVSTSPRDLMALTIQAADSTAAARSARTTDAYSSDWRDFAGWCDAQGLDSLPAESHTVVLYLQHLANMGRKPSTLRRRLVSISHQHQTAGLDSPTRAKPVRDHLRGLTVLAAQASAEAGQRSLVTKAAAIDLATLARIVAPIDTTTAKGLRDRALILFGLAGFFRRSELVGVTVEAIDIDADGVLVYLPRSKTNQTGELQTRAMRRGVTDLCPVRALTEWLSFAEITTGPVFRSVDRHGHVAADALTGRSVSRVLKSRAAAAGIDPENISGHSLRRGAATVATQQGNDLLTVARGGGWHPNSRDLAGYIEHDTALHNAPKLGL